MCLVSTGLCTLTVSREPQGMKYDTVAQAYHDAFLAEWFEFDVSQFGLPNHCGNHNWNPEKSPGEASQAVAVLQ